MTENPGTFPDVAPAAVVDLYQTPRTAAANAARTRRSLERDAARLRAHNWEVTAPENVGKDWQSLAGELAARLASHAFCDEHPIAKPAKDCPFCEDRAAYWRYRDATGRG